jgi:hypothetical protein
MNLDRETLQTVKQEIEAICKKYNIILVPVVVHQGDQTFSSIEIAPLKQQPQAEVSENKAE